MRDDLLHKGRSISDLKVRLVFTIKYKKRILTQGMILRLEEIIRDLLQNDCKLIEYVGGENYILITFQYPPELQMSSFVGTLKSVSSRKIRQEYGSYLAEYFKGDALWSNNYLVVSCGGLSIDLLNKFVSELESSNSPEA
jgi:putative transposase